MKGKKVYHRSNGNVVLSKKMSNYTCLVCGSVVTAIIPGRKIDGDVRVCVHCNSDRIQDFRGVMVNEPDNTQRDAVWEELAEELNSFFDDEDEDHAPGDYKPKEPSPVKLDTYVLWGEHIRVGDPLRDDQREALEKLLTAHSGAASHASASLLKNILTQEPRDLVPFDFNPVEVAEPRFPADELTQRAREAMIRIGDMPGIEQEIRSGMADGLSGIRAAIQALRDIDVEIDDLASRPIEVVRPIQEVLPPEPKRGLWDRVGAWWARMQNRLVRLYVRYDAVRKRNLELAAELVRVRKEMSKEIAKVQAKLDERKEKLRLKSMALDEQIGAKKVAEKRCEQARTRIGELEKEIRLLSDTAADLRTSLAIQISKETKLPHADFLRSLSRVEREEILRLLQSAQITRATDHATDSVVLSVKIDKSRLPSPEYGRGLMMKSKDEAKKAAKEERARLETLAVEIEKAQKRYKLL